MSNYTFTYCSPDSPDFVEFPKELYPTGSPRFIHGHEPTSTYLKGCYLLKDEAKTLGRFALYDNPLLEIEGKPCATVGSFECVKDEKIARILLNQASELAKQMGKAFLIGPMEGSTWNDYRFSDSNSERNFFMEPFHHAYYSDLFTSAGFNTLAKYVTFIDEVLPDFEGDIKFLEERFRNIGFKLRNLDMDHLEEDLYKMAVFSNHVFKDNKLFTPINSSDFIDKYRSKVKYLDPELILILENTNNEVEAILFAIPDHLDPENKTLIVKSLARRKDSPFKGVSAFLGVELYQIARKKGYERVIHAFMNDENSSVVVSKRFTGRLYKSYSLFYKTL